MRQHAQVVKWLASPAGNATGVNFFIAELAAKRLGLLREMAPGMALRSCKATAEFSCLRAAAACRCRGACAGSIHCQLDHLDVVSLLCWPLSKSATCALVSREGPQQRARHRDAG